MAVAEARKKWHLPPAFSVEYISYYEDRHHRYMFNNYVICGLMSNQFSINTTLVKTENITNNTKTIKSTLCLI